MNNNPIEKPSGFIKLSRKVRKHWLWKASRKKSKFEAWIDLIFRANIDPNKEPYGHDLIELKRGEILCSQEGLAKDWAWDRSAVRLFLDQLKSDGMITVKPTNKYTVITLCNYNTYNDKQPTKDQQDNNKKPGEQQQDNTYKNIKNRKSSKKVLVAPEEMEIEKNPFDDPALNENWQDWILFREEIKESITPTAAKKQISFLKSYSTEVAIQIIDRSIQNKWKGLFKLPTSSYISMQPLIKKMVD